MDLFTVLSDPIRRTIIEELAAGPLDAGTIADMFPVSRPAVSRHLRLLRESRLVDVSVEAQRRVYHLDAAPLAELDDWLDRYRQFWGTKLDQLTEHVEAHRDR